MMPIPMVATLILSFGDTGLATGIARAVRTVGAPVATKAPPAATLRKSLRDDLLVLLISDSYIVAEQYLTYFYHKVKQFLYLVDLESGRSDKSDRSDWNQSPGSSYASSE
jgi:hypothetical protein